MTRIKSVLSWTFALIWMNTEIGRSEAILHYFESEWEEIYRRLPEIAEAGYSAIWTPPPTKSPVAGTLKWANVGYSLWDRFDLGEIPQRGTIATRYGTRGCLRMFVDNAHQCDILIYPDLVFNHNGNGPNHFTYPGMKINDFHVWQDSSQPGGWKRANRMTGYDDISNGFGLTFQEELVSLIDIKTEPDNRFINNPPFFAPEPAPFVRHPGQPSKYPFFQFNGYESENVRQMLIRWVNWLGYAMDYDGARLDAAKHVVREFYGQIGNSNGFNHNIQWNFATRRGYPFNNDLSQMYANDIRRNRALVFSEIFTGSTSTYGYWDFGTQMLHLDFPLKIGVVNPAFGGNLSLLGSFDGLGPLNGIRFVQSHDQGPPARNDLAHAWLLTHIGKSVVYFSGNNITNMDANKTWVLPGHGAALGDYHNRITNMVYVRNQFARGKQWERWSDGDFYAFERYDDLNNNNSPNPGEALLLVALNDSGSPQTRTLQTAFPNGTVLKDYSGNNPNTVTVSGGQVTITVPGNLPGIPGGQGWVYYAPRNADANGEPIRFLNGNNQVGTINWIVPGGIHAPSKPRQIPRITTNSVNIDVHFTNPPDGTVDSVIIRWGQGRDLNPDPNINPFGGNNIISSGYMPATQLSTGHWRLTADLSNIPEGLHLIQARCFNQRPSTLPPLFQTFYKVVYVDRTGPSIQIENPPANGTIQGDTIVRINNPDYTAYTVEVSVNGGPFRPAHRYIRGLWKYSLSGLPAGTHTITVKATEADWGNPRSIINQSTTTRTFTVVRDGPPVAINHKEGEVLKMPFFITRLHLPTSLGVSNVKLYWDGYEMVGLAGTNGIVTHIFDGRYISGGVEDRLWGAFTNGPHFFEAVVTDANNKVTRVTRQVTYNLYGQNLTDSDGDGLPDDTEIPFYSTGTNPGPSGQLPGDTNYDNVPQSGENWTRLNPLNHQTYYVGDWDGDRDSDGDGVKNLFETWQGFLRHGNAFHFDIYNSGSKPSLADPIDADNDGMTARWEGLNGLNDSNAANNTQDPDNDGIPNLLEFAFNLDPQKYDADSLPQPTITNINGQDFFTITYLPNPDIGLTNVTVTAEFSSDLQNWSTAGIIFDNNHPVAGSVRARVPIGSNQRGFFRLRATK
ncbi:MAG: alpha-amylase family glycosyl hydrolase [Methylacidiphilales bacterium]|nr:alpha-amylase family glycosyl hydrolase [Candidatus Methylacidiphilales bacterium]MDW8348835.1 alpha-amylase family glycosyl hydrolase [Verrucomicrobiae bacterium]